MRITRLHYRILGALLLIASFLLMYMTDDDNLAGLAAGILAGLGVFLMIKGSFKKK